MPDRAVQTNRKIHGKKIYRSSEQQSPRGVLRTLPVRDLGNPRAVPMAKPDYERLRAAAIDGAAPA
jgi:hypothetical protein